MHAVGAGARAGMRVPGPASLPEALPGYLRQQAV